MPVVEITQLRLKGKTADDPTLLNSLSVVRDKLQTNSRFFCCFEDPGLIYIFGVWTSLDAHLEFLASPTCSEVLGPQEDILSFQWTVHLDLNETPQDILGSSVVMIQNFEVEAARIACYEEALEKHVQALQSTGLVHIKQGWRCDMPKERRQSVILTGWTSEAWHDTESGKGLAFASTRGSRETLLHCAGNIEHPGVDHERAYLDLNDHGA